MDELNHSALDLAIYATIHDYTNRNGRGAAALGPLVGISPAVLCNKANPNIDSHHLTLAEAVRIQAITGDYRIHEACDQLFGRVSIPAMLDFSGVSNTDLINAMADWQKECGETAGAVGLCLEGRTPKKSDLDNLMNEIYQDAQRGLEIWRRLKALGGDEA